MLERKEQWTIRFIGHHVMQLDTLSTPKNMDGMLLKHIVLSLNTVVQIVLGKTSVNSHLPNQSQ
nr:MAG TPA: hypothetical protein [Caudoviricetes sp.]